MLLRSLTDAEKQKLNKLAQNAPELFSRRARLILAYAEGKPTLQASKQAGISRGRARFWKRQFISKGMGIFQAEASGGSDTVDFMPTTVIRAVDLQVAQTLDYTKEANLYPGAPVPYPRVQQSIGISPDDTLAQAGRKVWLFYFAEMLSHEAGTTEGEDIEELHDMRVATRRMRTAFDIFGPAYDPRIMKRYLKGLRNIGRVLGQVRDMDVILEKAIGYRKKLKENTSPGLEALLSEWEESINRLRSKMIKHLQSEAYHHFIIDFNQFLQPADQASIENIHVDETISCLKDIVPVLVYSRYASVRAFERIVPSASVKELHMLRIEFKKFRYTLEYFREILGDGVNSAINELKQLQDHLGELHDADVACQLVSRFLKDWDENQERKLIPERSNPEPVVTYLANLHAERYHLIRMFPDLWRKFNRPEFRQNIAQAVSRL